MNGCKKGKGQDGQRGRFRTASFQGRFRTDKRIKQMKHLIHFAHFARRNWVRIALATFGCYCAFQLGIVVFAQPPSGSTLLNSGQVLEQPSAFNAFYVITPTGKRYYRPDTSLVFDDVTFTVRAVAPPAAALTRQSWLATATSVNFTTQITDSYNLGMGIEVRRNGLVNYTPGDYNLSSAPGSFTVTYPNGAVSVGDKIEVVYYK